MTIFVFTLSAEDDYLKIACVGDSLTYGYGLIMKEKHSYPAQLGRLSDRSLEVRNFGINGACASSGQKDSYPGESLNDVILWKPDLILIMLGSNDSKERIWQGKDFFLQSYTMLVKDLQNRTNSRIYIISAPPCKENVFMILNDRIRYEINPVVKKMAEQLNLEYIDSHIPLSTEENIFIDNIHLNKKGFSLLSEYIYFRLREAQFLH